MNMTSDIYSDKAIDLVIFTVVDEATIRSKVWDDDLISPNYVGEQGSYGLSLFVVTIPADETLYPMAKGKRVLPGGYLGRTESLEQASHRIANERLGALVNEVQRSDRIAPWTFGIGALVAAVYTMAAFAQVVMGALIDRMGGCVLGFDAATEAVGEVLEREIKRIVQVVEAYPDTGRRVFQTVLTEFEKFLQNYFTRDNEATRKAVFCTNTRVPSLSSNT